MLCGKPGRKRSTELREWFAFIVDQVEPSRALVVNWHTSGLVPFSSSRTSLREVNAFDSIEVLPGLAFLIGPRANALASVVERPRRTGNFDTSIAIPSLSDLAGRIRAGVLGGKPNEPSGAFTFVVQWVVDLVGLTVLDFVTALSTEPSSSRTFTSKNLSVPDLSILACLLWWDAVPLVLNFSTNTNTCFLAIIPNFSSLAGICDTVLAVPDSGRRAFASPCVLVPDHTALALLDNHAELAIPLGAFFALALPGRLVPVFPIDALNAGAPIPIKIFRALALQSLGVPSFSTAAIWLNHTRISIPKLAFRTDTLLEGFIVNSSSRASMNFVAVVSIPDVSHWAGTLLIQCIPDLPIDTLDTHFSVEEQTLWANTLFSVPLLPANTTVFLAPISVPVGPGWAHAFIFLV